MSGQHTRKPTHPRLRYAGLVLGGLAVISAAALGGNYLLPHHSPTVTTTTVVTSPPSPSPSASKADPCQAALSVQAAALEASEDAVEQWEKHTGAMEQLVAGKVTLKQASAFWNQQRKTSPTVISEAKVAEAKYQALRKPSACTKRLTAGDLVLGRAATCVSDFHHHSMDMEALRNGDLSPDEATRRWKDYWKDSGRAAQDAYGVARSVYDASR